MSYERIPLEQFQEVFGAISTGEPLSFSQLAYLVDAHPAEISSVALGGRAVRWSDEFFAEASNLLKVEVRTHSHAHIAETYLIPLFSRSL